MIDTFPSFDTPSDKVNHLTKVLLLLSSEVDQEEQKKALVDLADALPGLEQVARFAAVLAKHTVNNPSIPSSLQAMLASAGTFGVTSLDVLYDGMENPDVQHNLNLASQLVDRLNMLAELNGMDKPEKAEKAEKQKPNLTLVH